MMKTLPVRSTVVTVAAVALSLGIYVSCTSNSESTSGPLDDAAVDSGAADGNGNPLGDDGAVDGGTDANRPIRELDAGPITLLDAGDGSAVQCFGTGVLEVEPNDVDPALGSTDGGTDAGPSADNSLSAPVYTVCGTISPGTDIDVLTFKLKPQTKEFFLSYDGNIELTVKTTVDGGVETAVVNRKDPLPYSRGLYTVTVKSLDGSPQTYRVTLFEFTN